jgi:DNA-binding response OmpR family regulator
MRVLIAEDDSALANFVRKGLEAEHYAVDGRSVSGFEDWATPESYRSQAHWHCNVHARF